MCCTDSNEPAIVRRARCRAWIQLICEIISFVLSILTVRDAGYLGASASCIGLVGTIGVLARCGRVSRTFTLLCWFNVIAMMISIIHVALLLHLAETVHDWCCELEETNPGEVRSLLIALSCWFLVTVLVRLACLGPSGAFAARKAPLRAIIIPMGHPVPPEQAQVVVGVPVQPLPAAQNLPVTDAR
uniref:Transmembrane protein n=1 Tax=Haptolina brevifila TaxID=156173 RepID=A0A7S2E3H1_9EUKA|mmetsp:Transcript_46994/g.93632  ORF Transcript_46994/g.93632 Transcript_46994/m.93632 type:complete len:187 (+) Transcript_46994:114-674(+)